MPNIESWVALDAKQREEVVKITQNAPDNVCPDAWYAVIRQEDIPSAFSPALQGKCDHAIVMVSGDVTGTSAVLVCNAQRVDSRASAIDQEPFGIAISGDDAAPSGLFLHHGGWEGRTESKLDQHFWRCVEASGIGDIFPFQELPPDSSGPLDDLRPTSHDGPARSSQPNPRQLAESVISSNRTNVAK